MSRHAHITSSFSLQRIKQTLKSPENLTGYDYVEVINRFHPDDLFHLLDNISHCTGDGVPLWVRERWWANQTTSQRKRQRLATSCRSNHNRFATLTLCSLTNKTTIHRRKPTQKDSGCHFQSTNRTRWCRSCIRSGYRALPIPKRRRSCFTHSITRGRR